VTFYLYQGPEGDEIASVEHDIQGRLSLGWTRVVCLLVFEYKDSLQQSAMNGVTMTSPLSEVHKDGGDSEVTWMYTCVTLPPAHMVIWGSLSSLV